MLTDSTMIAPDQHFLITAINSGYLVLEYNPTHAEFVYLMLSRIDEDSYD